MESFTKIYEEVKSKMQNDKWNDELTFVDCVAEVIDEYSIEPFFTWETFDLLISKINEMKEERMKADMEILSEQDEKWDNVYPNNQ